MKINVINEVARKVREIDPECTIQKLQVLLCVAQYDPSGTDHQTLIQRLELSKSQASKLVADWTDLTSYKMSGPGLVESRIDPMNSRARIITLTPKGRQFIRNLQGDAP